MITITLIVINTSLYISLTETEQKNTKTVKLKKGKKEISVVTENNCDLSLILKGETQQTNVKQDCAALESLVPGCVVCRGGRSHCGLEPSQKPCSTSNLN